MSISTEVFTDHPAIVNPDKARHVARKRTIGAAAHAAPRRSRLARVLLETSPEQAKLLRENRERAWLELAGVVAGRI
jgi:hypothetical protein